MTAGSPASLGQKGTVGTLLGHRCSGEKNEVEMDEKSLLSPGRAGCRQKQEGSCCYKPINAGVFRAVRDALAPLSGQSTE